MSGNKPRTLVVAGLGLGQILAWGSSYYLLAILAEPVTADTGWPATLVVAGLSIGLVTSALVAPRVGSRIGQGHGRRLLVLSAALLSAGLVLMAVSPALWVYLAAWIVIGLGMGTGLYSSAFAALGLLYGESARTPITALTLFGGLASTICWPLSLYLVSEIGWRGTCGVYAALQLLVTIPLYLWVLPQRRLNEPVRKTIGVAVRPVDVRSRRPSGTCVVLLTSIVTLSGLITTTMSVHLFTLLGAAGFGMAAALALATLVGPSQVGIRLVELLFAKGYHPLWTMAASVLLVGLGLGILSAGLPLYALIMILYGAGIGLASVAHGTVPLAVFGAEGYASLMGRIALPALLAQAAAPPLGTLLINTIGASATSMTLALAAVANIGLVVWMMLLTHFQSVRVRAASVLTPGASGGKRAIIH
ncbi:MFS transporter [Cryobacterium serini]|uniref:MFS transporter n=1 Tax=Cryobacterium serini TaxID=1259201 RepID=A0A4R9BRV6_9MICO|nr:MFS transporter [Cryobacterium serini]TFD89845.1 MFS transporter [Cryobacterium serini]